MRECGIYKIENTINKKVYIGQSKNIPLRFSNHKYELNHGKHSNKHLQRAWNKYGKENFVFEILCECNPNEVNEKEIYFIKLYNSFERGYNRTEGGTDSETASEYGRRMAEIVHERRKTTKNKCLECGEETKDGYNKYCVNHKYKCKKCGTRYFYRSTICDKCMRAYHMNYCCECGKKIKMNSNRQKTCKSCSKILARRRKAKWRYKQKTLQNRT